VPQPPEGNSLGDYGYHNGQPKSLDDCKALCAAQPACKSFVFSESGQKCHLKDKVVTEGSDCADGSSWNFETYYLGTAFKSYTLYKSPKRWDEAKGACPYRLATWSNEGEWNRIKRLHKEAHSTHTWVGLGDYWEGHWEFVQSSRGKEDWQYCKESGGGDWGNCEKLPQWNSGEPNNAQHGDVDWIREDCAEISGEGLNDNKCSNRYWYVCMEMDPAGVDKVSDIDPVPQLPQPNGPVNAPGNYFVLDFASEQQGLVFIALAASNVIWMAVAVYYCCRFKKRKETETYSKVLAQSEDERLNA